MCNDPDKIKIYFLLTWNLSVPCGGRLSSKFWCENPVSFHILEIWFSYIFFKSAVIVCIKPAAKTKGKWSHHEKLTLTKIGLEVHIILVGTLREWTYKATLESCSLAISPGRRGNQIGEQQGSVYHRWDWRSSQFFSTTLFPSFFN